MPMYSHRCTKCNIDVDIIRTMAEFMDSPKPSEEPKVPCTSKNKKHKWKKIIRSAPTKAYGANWGYGSKGNW